MATSPSTPLAFIDLLAQRRRLGDRIDKAVMGAVDAGQWIMGPQVREFEKRLAEFGQAELALSCANGTDALVLPLMAWNVGPGDAVFCPSFTFAATAEVVPWVGATPVFVDVLADTYNMDPADLEAAIQKVKAEGRLTPKVIIAVDLFGQPADYPAISAIAKTHGLKLIADSAQGFGCTLNGQHPIHWADCTTTSFFPAKPLGCYGDGGAVLSNDAGLVELMDSLRVHGKATPRDIEGRAFTHDPKYLNMRVGMNSRLDTIQAAILIEKLDVFAWEIEQRNAIANRYAEQLAGVARTPTVIAGGVSSWAQYTIEVEDRDGLAQKLKAVGVPTAAYYPIPLHQQPAYSEHPLAPSGLPVTVAKASRVISLPMHPDLTPEDQAYITQSVHNAIGQNA
ncbi:MAG TPA: DegT/DnrJ/EryC1/StrS aminotransferase family protein [Caulobacter sp.]|nr:DegT/DnrJ/EryC1/StrS aminotransferase family protein [Caulobacter sp.]